MPTDLFSENKFRSLSDSSQKKKLRDLWQVFLRDSQKSADSFQFTLSQTRLWLKWVHDLDFKESSKTKIIQSTAEFASNNELIIDWSYDLYLFFCNHSNLGPDKKTIQVMQNFKESKASNLRTQSGQLSWTFCLWNLRSAHNAGSITRTSECMGLKDIILAGYTPGIQHAGFCAAAMGTQNVIQVIQIPDDWQALKSLSNGRPLIALETSENAIPIRKFNWPSSGGIIIAGNEETGLSHAILEKCDAVVSIPMYGSKESLNVSNACSICIWEILNSYQ